jgi:carboxypeptidase C (cathepsin A)
MANLFRQIFSRSYAHPPRAKRLRDVDGSKHVRLTIVLKPNAMPHHIGPPVSRDQYKARYATPDDVIQRITDYANNHGLVVESANPGHHLMHLSGTYDQACSAFAPDNLAVYGTDAHEFVSRHGHLHLPPDLAGSIVAVMGFDQRPIAGPYVRIRPRTTPPLAAYDPSAVAKRYQFPTGANGAGQTIGLIELGGGYDAQQMATYFESNAVDRTGVLAAVSVDGVENQPGDPNGADAEVQLDIEVAGSVAPGADIAVYFTSNQSSGFLNAIATAVHDTQHSPSVISISWGGPEAEWPAQDIDALNQAFQAAATLGITVCCASGDSGATDGLAGGTLTVDFPASSPYVLGCGGTRLPPEGPETAWNDGPNGGASGGGYSGVFSRPSWQTGTGDALLAKPGRGVPDVAGDADPATGYNVAIDGETTVAGGTSAVAPLWAGLVARSNQIAGRNAGFVNPALYQNPNALTDITQGNNNGYSAGPGWDPVTGLGSPLGAAVATALANTPAAETAAPISAALSSNPAVAPVRAVNLDQPLFDPVAYGNGPQDSVTDATESAAITHHTIEIAGSTLAYTATAGHLVTVDASSSKPNAKIFYVAFVLDGAARDNRPVTFFYNGGPGSSSVYVLLGSFAPMRIKTSLPDFTPPPPYTIETNPDSLLDHSDLVFINPVGTGYSAAIAPNVNKDFWGADKDAASLGQFIKRYLTDNDRWNSPKFLFGESYGTARSCILAYMLHEDGIELNGVTLQSSILDYTQAGNPIGLLPTYAADAWYHEKVGPNRPSDLAVYLAPVITFADTVYPTALTQFPKGDPKTVAQLSSYIGIDTTTLDSWSLNVAAADARGTSLFLTTLLQDKGLALGSYDGRATGENTGIAATIDPKSGSNDPTMTGVNGVYTAMWNSYLNDQLRFTSNSAFTDLNDQAFANWDFSHIDPTGVQKGIDSKGNVILYTAGDLAAIMSLNVDLKVFSANGYYDSVTPFHQTVLDLQNMPLGDAALRKNLTIRYFPSGHMIYLDGPSRTAMKADLAAFYDSAVSNHAAVARIRALQIRAA